MGFELLITLGISLTLTLVLELLFTLLTGKRNKKDYLLVCFVNIITNPVVVLTYYIATYSFHLNPILIIIPLEILAVLVEAYYYKTYGQDFKRPFLFSLFANTFSYGIGFVLNILI